MKRNRYVVIDPRAEADAALFGIGTFSSIQQAQEFVRNGLSKPDAYKIARLVVHKRWRIA